MNDEHPLTNSPVEAELREILYLEQTIPARMIVEMQSNIGLSHFYLSHGGMSYHSSRCPKCGTEAAFRWGFLGKMHHPECGHRWYAGPLDYVKRRLWRLTVSAYGQANWGYALFIGWWLEGPFIVLCTLVNFGLSRRQ